jgi:hypothetical protein
MSGESFYLSREIVQDQAENRYGKQLRQRPCQTERIDGLSI